MTSGQGWWREPYRWLTPSFITANQIWPFWQNRSWNSLLPHFLEVTIQCLWWKFLFQYGKPDSFFRLARWGTFPQHPAGGQRWTQELHRTGEHSRAQEKVAAVLGACRERARTGSGLAWMLGCLSAARGYAWVCRERPTGSFRAQRYKSTEDIFMPFGVLQLFCMLK